jgi:hypothetical protein
MFDIKFFQKDIISGSAKNVGDAFTAMFLGDVSKFIVVEIVDANMFYATFED